MDGSLPGASPAAALAARFARVAGAHDADASFPHENIAALEAAGLLAPLPLGPALELIGTIGHGCASTALVLAMHLIYAHLAATWPEPVRRRVGQGGLINALRVEPALGSPSRGGLPETVARRAGAGWALSGRKIYSTGAPGLRWMVVFARTDEPEPRIGTFLVEAPGPGIRIEESWDQLGLRASGSHDVVFTDAAAEPIELAAPTAWRADPVQQRWTALTVAALYTGVAEAARDWLVSFLRGRVPANLGAPLATLPRMQEAVGTIQGLLLTNHALIASTLEASPADCALAKTVAAENAIRAVEEAVKLTGNHGLSRANPLERHLRDVMCARVHTPQADAAYVAAGRGVLGC